MPGSNTQLLLWLFLGSVGHLVPSTPLAGNNANAAISLHITEVVDKGACTTNVDDIGYTTFRDTYPQCGPVQAQVYVLVCNGSDRMDGFEPMGTGVAGMELGIIFDEMYGMNTYGWFLCADQAFPSLDWPGSGSGIALTWDAIANCQEVPSEPFVPNTVIAIGGYFRVDVQFGGIMTVTPRPVSGQAKVADCNASEDTLNLLNLGTAGFCNNVGENSCYRGDPIQRTTWGAIKSQFTGS